MNPSRTFAREDFSAISGKAALALGCMLYVFARCGAQAGTHVAIAAALFVLLDFAALIRRRSTRVAVIVVFAQVVVIGALCFAPAPFGFGSQVPPHVLLDTPLPLLLLAFLASCAAAARPALLWAAGTSLLAFWIVMWRLALSDPHTITRATLPIARLKTALAVLDAIGDPHYFNFGIWWKTCIITTAMITAALALALYRTRRLARESAAEEARRSALAAFFSPQLVDTIFRARADNLAAQNRQIAVLDCDLVGFTPLAETALPETVAAGLRLYRSVIEDAVFEEDGAILSHTGDGAIALFGLARPADDASARALRCALAITQAWPRAARGHFGDAAPALAIGIDYGAALVGLVGESRNVSLVAIGPAIASAAALQHATREAGAEILIGCGAKAALRDDAVALEHYASNDIQAWRIRIR